MRAIAEIRIGTSGWRYPPWRGVFYPQGLAQRRELEYLSRRMNAVEINGSFYSLQRPERYRAWFDETPAGFLFAVKGGRFIAHMKQLRDVETALANFYASGVLALGAKLGPFLWQLPPRLTFDPDRLANFFALLPRTTTEAAQLAAKHDDKLKCDPYLEPGPRKRLQHALEVRHPPSPNPRRKSCSGSTASPWSSPTPRASGRSSRTRRPTSPTSASTATRSCTSAAIRTAPCAGGPTRSGPGTTAGSVTSTSTSTTTSRSRHPQRRDPRRSARRGPVGETVSGQ